jgi:hypothetical protein
MNYFDVVKILAQNKDGRNYPSRSDARFSNGLILPTFKPKFAIDLQSVNSVFTIGSCFARNIEEVLQPMGVNLPTKKFAVPKHEWQHRPNGLLNEYNPGSISQKILATLQQKSSPVETIFQHRDTFYDLLLCAGNGVSYQRAISRRKEIEQVYQELLTSEVVIITLGLVEAWYDNATQQWLNRMPPFSKEIDAKRFTLKRLDVDQAMPLLQEAFAALDGMHKKIVLTVSPVPMQTTFNNSDCVVANEFSKSVLRVCADRLSRDFNNVDYFPSYEIARAAGFNAYIDDLVHVKHEVVESITRYMINKYQQAD